MTDNMNRLTETAHDSVVPAVGVGRRNRSRLPVSEYDFRFRQDDLEHVCRDRELETIELHPANDFYGQASILKRYVGWPESHSLKGIIEHAPQYNETMWEYDRDQRLPLILTTNSQRAAVCREQSTKRIRTIGFSGVYARRYLEQHYGARDAAERKGTIVFPCHSSHLCQAVYSHERYAERLSQLPDDMKPITVCIYWRDFLAGSHEPYRSKGMRIVSAGHMYDKDFLLRFCDLLTQFRYAVSNEMGTHVLMSVMNGCAFSYVKSEPIQYRWDTDENAEANAHFRDDYSERVIEESESLFGSIRREMTSRQIEFAERILGSQHVLDPPELKKVLRYAERLDWWLPQRMQDGQGKWLPYRWQRAPTPWKVFRRRFRLQVKGLFRRRRSHVDL